MIELAADHGDRREGMTGCPVLCVAGGLCWHRNGLGFIKKGLGLTQPVRAKA